jgi:hypothetical protein
MINSVASYTSDPAGYIELDVKDSTTAGKTSRRVNRIATLDGGAVFNDAGYSEADRTIELLWMVKSASTEYAVDRLVRTYTRLTVAVRSGVYLTSPQSFESGTSESKLTLLVVSKLSS